MAVQLDQLRELREILCQYILVDSAILPEGSPEMENLYLALQTHFAKKLEKKKPQEPPYSHLDDPIDCSTCAS